MHRDKERKSNNDTWQNWNENITEGTSYNNCETKV